MLARKGEGTLSVGHFDVERQRENLPQGRGGECLGNSAASLGLQQRVRDFAMKVTRHDTPRFRDVRDGSIGVGRVFVVYDERQRDRRVSDDQCRRSSMRSRIVSPGASFKPPRIARRRSIACLLRSRWVSLTGTIWATDFPRLVITVVFPAIASSINAEKWVLAANTPTRLSGEVSSGLAFTNLVYYLVK
jgi:hypothetical protein